MKAERQRPRHSIRSVVCSEGELARGASGSGGRILHVLAPPSLRRRAHAFTLDGASMIRLQGIDHVALAVRDVESSAHWYEEVLGLTRRHQEVWGSFPAVVGVGTTSLALFPVAGTNPRPRPGRDTLAVRHIAFRVDAADFRRAQEELRHRGITFEFQDHQIAHSIYFPDPDGHQLEITTYELEPPQG